MGLLVACQSTPPVDPDIRAQIAQKLMLDFRYYCDFEVEEDQHCTEPVTQLPKPLATLITETGIGGVILFAENLQSPQQTVQLNHQLQTAAKAGNHPALFIAIDQEGGRVARFPRHLSTSFSGNMALGASYAEYGTTLARDSGAVIGAEIAALGFNVNFAPTVDVNVNPNNPVINVRSYGENPQQVAELGLAQVRGMQQAGVITALKHFPGHGDTNVDSHVGLPKVAHSVDVIEQVDLYPFQYIIEQDNPGMVMTAHIQYPQLDNTQIETQEGEKTTVPATLSRHILTGLLREKMGYQGLIVTDAMDMAAIAQFFNKTDALIGTFRAGADIALMPYAIRSKDDIQRFLNLLDELTLAVQDGRLNQQEVSDSVARILKTKQQYQLADLAAKPLDEQLQQVENVLANKDFKQVELAVARAAVTPLTPASSAALASSQHVHLLMPDSMKCTALSHALRQMDDSLSITCDSLAKQNTALNQQAISQADVLIAADISPQQSMAELGGMDDLKSWQERRSQPEQQSQLLAAMQQAKQAGKKVVFLSLRAPYNFPDFAPYTDIGFATFAYHYEQPDESLAPTGPIYQALAEVLTGSHQATGQLPVSLDAESH